MDKVFRIFIGICVILPNSSICLLNKSSIFYFIFIFFPLSLSFSYYWILNFLNCFLSFFCSLNFGSWSSSFGDGITPLNVFIAPSFYHLLKLMSSLSIINSILLFIPSTIFWLEFFPICYMSMRYVVSLLAMFSLELICLLIFLSTSIVSYCFLSLYLANLFVTCLLANSSLFNS